MQNIIRIKGIEYKVLQQDNNIKKALLKDIKEYTYSVVNRDTIKTNLSLDASQYIYNGIN